MCVCVSIVFRVFRNGIANASFAFGSAVVVVVVVDGVSVKRIYPMYSYQMRVRMCIRICGKDVNETCERMRAREHANAKNINYKDIKPKSRIIHVIRHGTHTAKVSRKIWVMLVEPRM